MKKEYYMYVYSLADIVILLSTNKGALDSQPQVIEFTSCLPMVGGSLRVLQLLPPLKLVAEILLKVALSTKNLIKKIILLSDYYPLFQPEYNRVIID
jgi:hypothetical protein